MSAKEENDKGFFSKWWEETLCDTIKRFYDESKIDDVLEELFTIYQYHLLALERQDGADEIGNIPKLRDYFMTNNGARLKNYQLTNLMNYLQGYLDFQKIFDNTRTLEQEDWDSNIDFETKKLLDILSYHPYKNIKRPVCIYYFIYKNTKNFYEKFKKFLKKYI